jgi:hypothetical protein
MRGRAFLLLLYALSVATAEAKEVDLHFVAVPAEDSGLTHKVEIRSETIAEGIKYPWMSSLVDINADGHLDIMYYGHHGGGAAIWFGKGDGTFKLDPDGFRMRFH